MQPSELIPMLIEQPVDLESVLRYEDPKKRELFNKLLDEGAKELLDDPEQLKADAQELGTVAEVLEIELIRDLVESAQDQEDMQYQEELKIAGIAYDILQKLVMHLRITTGQPKSRKIGEEYAPVPEDFRMPAIEWKWISRFLILHREEMLLPLNALKTETRNKVVRAFAMMCSKPAINDWSKQHDQKLEADFNDQVLEEMCAKFQHQLSKVLQK